ncbi:MAG: hypothetical protein Q4D76_16610 [Oscillospiraceae bacterium]|nr:hypothetical protein [Oscillospiraceae bacterium]
MSLVNYIKRAGKYIIKGVPEKKVFVSVDNVNIGDTLKGKNCYHWRRKRYMEGNR